MAAIRLSEAQTALSNDLQDTSDVTGTLFLQWCQYLSNFVWDVVTMADPERYIVEYQINVVPGVTNYALPTNFMSIQAMGCGIYIQNSEGVNTDQTLAPTGFGASANGFYIYDDEIVLTPTPTQSGVNILRYIPEPPTYTALTEYFTVDKLLTGKQIVPGRFLQYVLRALEVLYSIWDADAPMESYADQRFQRELSLLASRLARPPMAYSLPDFSQQF